MVKINIKKYSYTILLAASLLVVTAAWKAGYVGAEEKKAAGICPVAETRIPPQELFQQTEEEEEQTEEAEEAKEPPVVLRPVQYEADISWFDDALFIGDSRTVGLHEYGDLGRAEVVADSGMSVYKLFGKKFTLSSGEKATLEELLSTYQYKKIYFMLGINELGYDFEQTIAKYQEAVTKIRELQPDAMIFLQANLHIAKEKSESSSVYNNANINRINEAAKAMADNETIFYLDVNELFDDEEGNLSAEYTADQSHVLGKYYADWVKWILQHAVTFAPAEPEEASLQ